MTEQDPSIAQLSALAPLAEPVRLALYRFVASQAAAVGRDKAAAAVGVPHHVAKFHLDRLVDDGWLVTEYRRPPGRGGPGAGRPAKLYRPSGRSVEVSVPDRRYQLVASLLADAIERVAGEGIPMGDALSRVATEAGRLIGASCRESGRGGRARRGRQLQLDAAQHALSEHGYEARADTEGGVELANCPFDALAREHTDLVCGINLEFLRGVLEGLGVEDVAAVLDPAPGRCCVRLIAR